MKLKFKTQAYQTAAVQAVVDCFKGQPPHHGGIRYRLDPGASKAVPASPQPSVAEMAVPAVGAEEKEAAFRNADLMLSDQALLSNIQEVQRQQNLLVSASLTDFYALNAKGERHRRSRLTSSRRPPSRIFIWISRWKPAPAHHAAATRLPPENVKYDVADSFGKLMEVVK